MITITCGLVRGAAVAMAGVADGVDCVEGGEEPAAGGDWCV
jgi:hypothetical protein